MASPCSQARSYSSSCESSSNCRSPTLSIQSDSSAYEFGGRKLFHEEQIADYAGSKIPIETFTETRKKLSFPSPEFSELHEHLQALDGLDDLVKWPFSRKHRQTPTTSSRKKIGPSFVEKIAAEIRAIETRTNELHHHDQSLQHSNSASKKQKLWLFSMGLISLILICVIVFCVIPIILSSKAPL
jgi:hypothetical protein